MAKGVRLLAVPIIVAWALIDVSTNTFIPQVERVAEQLAGSMTPSYALSQVAMLRVLLAREIFGDRGSVMALAIPAASPNSTATTHLSGHSSGSSR
jgi:hypothetical protein